MIGKALIKKALLNIAYIDIYIMYTVTYDVHKLYSYDTLHKELLTSPTLLLQIGGGYLKPSPDLSAITTHIIPSGPSF